MAAGMKDGRLLYCGIGAGIEIPGRHAESGASGCRPGGIY